MWAAGQFGLLSSFSYFLLFSFHAFTLNSSAKSSLCSLDFNLLPQHVVNILHVALVLHSCFFPHMLLINPIYWLIELLRRCLSSRINTLVPANWYCVNWLCFSVQPYFNKPLTVPQNALLCVWNCLQSPFLVAQKRFVFSNPLLKPDFNTWDFFTLYLQPTSL